MVPRHTLMLTALAAGAFAFSSSAALAAITFLPNSNTPQPEEEIIHFTPPFSGTTVTGTGNKTGTLFDFTSDTGQTLDVSGPGASHITTSSGAGLITGITVSAPGHLFTDFIVDLHALGVGNSAPITVTEGNGTVDHFTLTGTDAGSAFSTIFATGGQTIKSIDYSTPTGITQFAQPRPSGPITVIPEPSTWAMMLLGFAGLGYIAFLRGRASPSSSAMA